MADVENQQESSSFSVKRKSEQDNVANKTQKLNSSSNFGDSESKNEGINLNCLKNLNETESTSPEKPNGSELEKDENGVTGDHEDEEEEIEPEIDKKGKGISREDKGKGKLIEVEDSDDEDDSDDDDDEEGFDEDYESDFSDDPLAEVDLDNILPSRTRRRSIQPGVYISNEIINEEEDDDSSEDSDA